MSTVPRLSLTLTEAAESCGVSIDVLKAAVASGKLKAKRTGPDGTGKYLFTVEQLKGWFDTLEDA